MSEMNSVKWHFREMLRTEVNENIELGELLPDEATDSRLVREVIQNSLDASVSRRIKGGRRSRNNPVKVRFSLAGLSNPLPAERANDYFDGLVEHLIDVEGLDEQVRTVARVGMLTEHVVPFIVIEDAGTMGLQGNPGLHDDPPANSTSSEDFYWFFRNVGRSGKGATENGSWGLGKWAMPATSGASSIFALTTTDQDTLLMGQCVLKEHHLNGAKYAPYGYWSQPEQDGFAMPLRTSDPQHRPIIDKFIEDFDLRWRDKSGLSVVIPFPRGVDLEDEDFQSINTLTIANAVVHNYFYPIVRGWLEVSIDGEEGEMPVTIDAKSIRDVVGALNPTDGGQWTIESYRRIFDMVDETSDVDTDAFTVLSRPPRADDDYDHADDLRSLKSRYDAGELLPFTINTQVRPKGENEVGTSFNIFLRKHPELEIGHDYFVRGTLSIPKMDYIKNYHALALVVVDEKERLAEMLRDSEPAAHSMWRPQAKRVRDRWVAPQRRINAVRDSVKNMLFFLEGQPSGLQKDAFLDLFALTGAEMAAESGGESGPGTRSKRFDKKIKPGPPSPFTISATKGGVSIHASKQAIELPNQIVVRAAYDVPRGNAFAKFNENDFAFRGKNGLHVKLVGGEILEDDPAAPIGANAVQLKVKDRENFSFRITGFDEFRDVVVKIDSDDRI